LELIVVDGGSTDETLQFIEKYRSHISVLISEKDDGQYHAITKGFAHATGDIYCWLNADDVSFPWSMATVGRVFSMRSDVKWLIGIPAYLNEDGSIKKIYNNVSSKPNKAIRNGWYRDGGYGYLQQESMFWRKELWEQVGGLDTGLSLAADLELWTRFAVFAELWTIAVPLSAFRVRAGSRSVMLAEKYLSEMKIVTRKLKKLPLIFRIVGKSKAGNFLLRLLIWKKSNIIYQPFNSNQLVFQRKLRSICPLTFTALLLETGYYIRE
jgi:glycosyltransferase involved in cell wall biosynthesis